MFAGAQLAILDALTAGQLADVQIRGQGRCWDNGAGTCCFGLPTHTVDPFAQKPVTTIPAFVYEQVRVCEKSKIIEVDLRPRKGPRGSFIDIVSELVITLHRRWVLQCLRT